MGMPKLRVSITYFHDQYFTKSSNKILGTDFHYFFSLKNVDPHDQYDALWFTLTSSQLFSAISDGYKR